MAEQKMIIGIGLPLILLLAMLVLFGVTWLFHHHHWRPFAGIFLFVIGLGFFGLLTVRHDVQMAQSVATSGPYEAHGTDRGGSRRVQSEMNFDSKTATKRENSSGSWIVAEKPVAPAPRTETDTKSAEADLQPATSDVRLAVTVKKPDWVDHMPGLALQDNGLDFYEATATSGLWSTPAECDAAIVPAIDNVVAEYVAEHVPEAAGEEIVQDPSSLRKQLVRDRYLETVDTPSFGKMKQLHVLLVFDSAVLDEFKSRARLAKVDGRLKYAAAGTALTLLLLGGVYSLLRKRERGTSAAAK
jgi:hypothetical protein